ncbi:MAG: hypothetical protein M1497_13390 [Nitrospirae bacterium]|nr:hypothetical protein [Nitrospirota bacterium]
MEQRLNAKAPEEALCPFPADVDFLVPLMASCTRVSEVFVSDEATKTFNFVAFFVEVGS